jgi:type IV secretory pathway protease TraF
VRDLIITGSALALLTFLLAPALGLSPPLILHNTSPSVPLGYWLYSTKWPPERGDIVAMRHDPAFWPGKRVLMKRVEGVAGDLFCWHDGRHWINDRPMPALDPLAFQMEELYREAGFTIWRGCRALESNEIAGFGDGGRAYGSGFYGPVRLSDLWGVYEHL